MMRKAAENEQVLVSKDDVKRALYTLDALYETKALEIESYARGYRNCLIILGILEPQAKEKPENLSFTEMLEEKSPSERQL